jgi:erythromycin esterase
MIGPALVLLAGAALAATAAEPVELTRERPVSLALAPPETVEATIALQAGESADLAVLQEGIDVVVDVIAPDGTRLDTIDSPNGRQGDEPVSLFASVTGAYQLHVRPIAANEPAARITIRVVALRDVAETRALLAERRRAREEAAAWLRRQDAPIPADVATAPSFAPFDTLAANARVIGLGEATHGSREFNDFRLAAVQRLVARHGYRLIALEDSGSRWRALEPYVRGEAAEPAGPLEWGWIGRRGRRALLEWARAWNLAHPRDRVQVIGVDGGDNASGRDLLAAFLERAYGAPAVESWRARLPELEAADARAAVFGNSSTSVELRAYLMGVVAQLEGDRPLLRRRFGRAYEAALAAARDVAAFVDYNAGRASGHSRDWHMAVALLRAVDESPGPPKAVYWAHNAHVATTPTRWGPTGALLRQVLGCGYRAVAATFGEGGFVAQLPDDPDYRLRVSSLPPAAEETLEGVFALVRPGAHLAAWDCDAGAAQAPAWLAPERPLRWIGGIYAPDTPPSLTYQPYRLVGAFDAIAYFPRVAAEDIPPDHPEIRPRPPTP